MKRHLLALLSLAAALPAVPALADNATLASPLARDRSTDQTETAVGVVAGYVPSYLGSDKSVWRAGLTGEANFANGVYLSSVDGIGYRFLNNSNGFSASASLGVSGGRKEKDGDDNHPNRLLGMGDVGNRAQANLYLNYDQGPFHATAGLHQVLSSHRGAALDLTGRYDLYATKTDLVQASAGLTYANRDMMQSYFGVTPAQSANSGNMVYTASSGVAGLNAGLTWRHAIDQHWVTTLSAGALRLGSSAADSPLTEKRNQAGIGGSVAYRF
jgi:outer membrane protein